MQIMESIDVVPMDGDVAKITRRAEEFRDLPEALQRNLQTFLTLTMDALAATHQKVKTSMVAETTKQMVMLITPSWRLAYVLNTSFVPRIWRH